MIGIIYKLTIIAKYKKDGYKPFYIGQHYCNSEIEFINTNCNYVGSGSIWLDFIKGLKLDYPEKWRHFIKREILYSGKDITQSALDALEKHYIKKYKSHYSFRKGGCNVLYGTANQFGSGSPAKDPIVKKKISNTVNDWYASEDGMNFKKEMSKRKTGQHLSKEVKEKIRNSLSREKCVWYGKHLSEETKKILKDKAKERYSGENGKLLKKKISNRKYPTGEKHHNFGKKTSIKTINKIKDSLIGSFWVNNGIENRYLKRGSDIPLGFKLGLIYKRKSL